MDNQVQPITTDEQGTQSFLNLESLIKNSAQAIDRLKDELKQKREMLADSFNNNPTYHEHAEKVKEASKAKASVRAEIAKQPSVAALKQQVDDLRFDIKEQTKTMSDLLIDYQDQTGATQLELFGGIVYEIKLSVKLVKGSKMR